MDTGNSIVLATLIYKLACLAVGSFSCYMGYRLFVAGVWGNSGDLRTNFGNTKLVLRNAAPGTFFVVLGSGVIVATIWQGQHFSRTQESAPATAAAPAAIVLPALPAPIKGDAQ